MSLQIPQIPTQLYLPVHALAQAAFLFRGVFVQAAEGRSIRKILRERGTYLAEAERVIDCWCSH